MKEGTDKLVTTRHIKSNIALNALLKSAYAQEYASALWRLPHDKTAYLAIDKTGPDTLEEINLEELIPGFIFCPFDETSLRKFIRIELFYSFSHQSRNDGLVPADNTARHYLEDALKSSTQGPAFFINPGGFKDTIENHHAHFCDMVAKGVHAIEQGLFEKVVPSRASHVQLDKPVDAIACFEKLCEQYPNTLVSLVSIPGIGTWLGASPELLVSVEDQKWFKTVALAGTQAYHPEINLQDVAWTQKEIEEQALVSRYIINCFKKIRLREFEEHGPKTIKAANLLHLKTDFLVDVQATNFPQLGSVMLKLLHPTSAVCGMPLESSLKFLLEHEQYERTFYSGFLGPVNCFNQSHVYVNLRCMQLFERAVTCYAGAGVTLNSIPEKEWMETEMKMKTMLDILN